MVESDLVDRLSLLKLANHYRGKNKNQSRDIYCRWLIQRGLYGQVAEQTKNDIVRDEVYGNVAHGTTTMMAEINDS